LKLTRATRLSQRTNGRERKNKRERKERENFGVTGSRKEAKIEGWVKGHPHGQIRGRKRILSAWAWGRGTPLPFPTRKSLWVVTI